jgi:hypothetical protein
MSDFLKRSLQGMDSDRLTRHVILLLAGFSLTSGQQPSAPAKSALQDINAIVAGLDAASKRQHANLCWYSNRQQYTMVNEHLNPSAEMDVQLQFAKDRGKRFQVLSIRATGIAKRSFQNLLQEESRAGRGGESGTEAINSSNYSFQLIGMMRCGSNDCYHLRLLPRNHSKYVLYGSAWINAKDFGLVRIEGKLAKSPSHWISPPEVEQRFEKVNEFWLPSFDHSRTHVLFAGDVDLTIKYSDYQTKSCGAP